MNIFIYSRDPRGAARVVRAAPEHAAHPGQAPGERAFILRARPAVISAGLFASGFVSKQRHSEALLRHCEILRHSEARQTMQKDKQRNLGK